MFNELDVELQSYMNTFHALQTHVLAGDHQTVFKIHKQCLKERREYLKLTIDIQKDTKNINEISSKASANSS